MNIDEDRFDRQKRVANWNQHAIEGSRILVVGAGALGNEVIKNLLQLGVREIAVVDYDLVVKANLNRCVFFTERDAALKRRKVEVIAEQARLSFPFVSIRPLPERVENLSEEVFTAYDYCFSCLDSLAARLHLNAQCYGKMPLIDGGTTGFLGKVQVVNSPSSCLECTLTKRDEKILWERYSCVGEVVDVLNPKMPALPTTTGVIASLQVNEFVKLAHFLSSKNEEEKKLFQENLVGKYLSVNLLKNEYKVFEIHKRDSCNVHPG